MVALARCGIEGPQGRGQSSEVAASLSIKVIRNFLQVSRLPAQHAV
jgi:hypothetical protein